MIVQKILITTIPIVFLFSTNGPVYNHLWTSITVVSCILVFAKLYNYNFKNITHEEREKDKIN